MMLRPLAKKTLIVSSWAPPRPGGSAQHLYNFFSQFDPATYAIYTKEENMRVAEPGPTLSCAYHFFPKQTGRLSVVRRIREGLRLVRTGGFEVLYGTGDTGGGLVLALMLSLLSDKPLVLHFLDMYRGNSFKQPWGVISWFLEPLVLLRARQSIFPNEAIYEEYCRRYGLLRERFSCINNGTFEDPYQPRRTPIERHEPPYSIVVTGSIYWAQEESIHCLAHAIEDAPDLIADIYIPRRVPGTLERAIGHIERVHLLSAEPATMPGVQTQADALFIPLARPSKSSVVTRTAVPGKLPEYLVSGRPIIVHAPEDSFMTAYARREGFAHVVTSYDPKVLRSEIRRVVADTAYQKQLVENALQTFARFHDARQNAQKIADVIEQVRSTRRA